MKNKYIYMIALVCVLLLSPALIRFQPIAHLMSSVGYPDRKAWVDQVMAQIDKKRKKSQESEHFYTSTDTHYSLHLSYIITLTKQANGPIEITFTSTDEELEKMVNERLQE